MCSATKQWEEDNGGWMWRQNKSNNNINALHDAVGAPCPKHTHYHQQTNTDPPYRGPPAASDWKPGPQECHQRLNQRCWVSRGNQNVSVIQTHEAGRAGGWVGEGGGCRMTLCSPKSRVKWSQPVCECVCVCVRGWGSRVYRTVCSGTCEWVGSGMWNNSAPLNSSGAERSPPPQADGWK